ncbi:ribosomal large subunit pseudouridine synthase D [Clostridiales bacterium]|nr:ribosomal large subunit pseudouridine synthase D [Clostridiales bacterium]
MRYEKMNNDIITLAAGPDDIGKRIDVFASENYEELSRSGLKKLIENGKIFVNDKAVKANYKLRNGDLATLIIPENQPLEIIPQNIPLDILYEDDDVIVINKPQKMVVHPAPGHYTDTLVNALMYHCGDSLSGINGVLRPGIVHRIDMDTSGVLMAAKNNNSHRNLAVQLAEHSITRRYNAIVYNNVKENEGTVDKPLSRNPQDRKKMAVVSGGVRAVTHYRVLERLGKFTYIEAQLETGRTHQIRVHMTYIGHPLLGDKVYGPKKQPFSLDGQVLHARVLGFVHPSTGEYMEFEAPLPEYFNKLLERCKQI